MIRVRFRNAEGTTVSETDAEDGTTLLEAGQGIGQPLEGTCEGQMACSTCHVIVDPEWFAKLPKAKEEEEDMLDLAACATRYSRLSCQILLNTDLDGITVRVPPESRNMQGR